MTKQLPSVFARCVILLAVMGCGSSRSPDELAVGGDATNAVRKVAVQLNWYAEAEHGGVYQAANDGTYQAAGFEVDVRPGGRATPVAAEVVMGRAVFAITNADDVVLYRAAGSDVVALMAAMQDHPRCVLARVDSGMKTWDDLKGMTLQRQEGQGFVEFLRARGILDGVREVPYHGSVANLVADPKIAVQAYSFAEPFLAQEAGVEVKTWMVSDLGWNPYSSVLVTRGDLVRKNPELVAEFVNATRTGWQNYIREPEVGNQAILAANSHGMTAAALEFGSAALVKLAQPNSMPDAEVGKMTLARWQSLVDQMVEIKLIEPGAIKAADCFTDQFLMPALKTNESSSTAQ